jgi:hypothetical protein
MGNGYFVTVHEQKSGSSHAGDTHAASPGRLAVYEGSTETRLRFLSLAGQPFVLI